jgi:hypothetical protein
MAVRSRIAELGGVAALVLATLVCSALLACSGSSGSTGARPGSQPRPSTQSSTAVPAVQGVRGPRFGGAAPGSYGGGGRGIIAREIAKQARREAELPQRLEDEQARGQRVAGEAFAQLPPPSDEGPCRDAWDARVAMGEQLATPPSPSERADFLRGCEALPEEQQRCLVPRYVAEHGEECGELIVEQAERGNRELRRHTGLDAESGRRPPT